MCALLIIIFPRQHFTDKCHLCSCRHPFSLLFIQKINKQQQNKTGKKIEMKKMKISSERVHEKEIFEQLTSYTHAHKHALLRCFRTHTHTHTHEYIYLVIMSQVLAKRRHTRNVRVRVPVQTCIFVWATG